MARESIQKVKEKNMGLKKWFFIARWAEGATNRNFREDSRVHYATDKQLLRYLNHVSVRDPHLNGMVVFELTNTGEKLRRPDFVQKYFHS